MILRILLELVWNHGFSLFLGNIVNFYQLFNIKTCVTKLLGKQKKILSKLIQNVEVRVTFSFEGILAWNSWNFENHSRLGTQVGNIQKPTMKHRNKVDHFEWELNRMMANFLSGNNSQDSPNPQLKWHDLLQLPLFVQLNRVYTRNSCLEKGSSKLGHLKWLWILALLTLASTWSLWNGTGTGGKSGRCFLPLPKTWTGLVVEHQDCHFCRGLKQVDRLVGVDPDEFERK